MSDAARERLRAAMALHGQGDIEGALAEARAALALANALAVVPEDVAAIEPGDEVTCLILSP